MSPAVGSNKRFQTIAINLINNIQSHRFSSLFLQPVSKREVPDYYEIIHEPKDLKSIMKAVKGKSDESYNSLQQLERDVMLMFANCIMFNHSDKDLVNLARTMRDDAVNTFKLFKEAEM
ncbi:Bromodomain-containing protein [Yamadazyma tenuis ATCC 10573]|uniref:Bromodomain-containing protein n=2 Tax=Candida tenuis TaxID=2315449 RepID=G3B584_CANTC|nr:Bromodomain-containing protein [Yamadazyma tenuis ATCC 10573]EGV63161.1 Bromodomain-containing protein [Yamadazyma tenuis ATCC 10573]